MGPPGLDLEPFGALGLDLELFQAPGLDFAAIWASSAWFGTTCGTSQGSIWSHLGLQGLICEPFGLDLEPFGPPGLDKDSIINPYSSNVSAFALPWPLL